MYIKIIKPSLDLMTALVGFIILCPIFFLLTLLLTLNNSGSPFFFQKRPGKDEKIFKVIKFKTMTDFKDPKGNLLPDSDRLTPLGKLIRKTSLDEIPQLVNVIKGDMSIVGPRPLLPEYLPLYNDFQKRRHMVKPGITGWAQVNGRNLIDWKTKFEFDVWYVNNVSFLLDIKILIKTVEKVFKSEGINNKGQATTKPFRGNYG